ncbi:transporter substrate-binding domain-containing protein [Janthinobacterium sp.]|uniref:substrate-binding periplasmic protein n=1 Tax=Janthinobacterium sp. TaxID=1871054 RepID=UPI00293D2A11|nr:transporter substrate-binding domain-containing protein [Janthinobacterium sp.]
MLVFFRAALLALSCCCAAARAEDVALRVAYEDKDTPDYAGAAAPAPPHPAALLAMLGQLRGRIPELRLVLSRKPWPRCLSDLESGAADAVLAGSATPQRLALGALPMRAGRPDRRYRLASRSYSLYKRKDAALAWDGRRFRDLEGRLGVMRGYAIGADLNALGIPVSEVDLQENAFRMLLAGRLGGVVQLSAEADHLLAGNAEFGRIAKVAPPVAVKDYYLLISRGFQAEHPRLARRIWAALAEMRRAEARRLAPKRR